MSFLDRLSLRWRFLTVVGLACAVCATLAIGVSIHYNEIELEHGIIQKSQTIHSRLEASTDYVAKQGGLAPTIERFTKKYQNPDSMTKEDKLAVLKQVPIFAAMKIGSQDADKEFYTFRVFSDEPRRKENQATADELAIFNKFKQNPELNEYVENKAGLITVYRPVHLKESQGCLTCHGNPSTSPWGNGKDVLGYRMEDWKDGKLHGVFAVVSNIAAVAKAQSQGTTFTSTFLLTFFIILGSIASLIMAAFMVNGPITNLVKVTEALSHSGGDLGTASEKIASASHELSQAATEQAASLAETAASVEEMNAIVKKNSENARDTATTSSASKEKAETGQGVVKKMIDSMGEINESNAHIMEQIDESNKRIAEIVKVINDIGVKTKVINDIVFQTKLLSFNASVEAARAGEHGKGFAVVAEEVGNLAQMSGNAAKEITTMLTSSTEKVESIVKDTKTKVEALISVGKSKVEAGTTIAHQCGDVLNEIVDNVSKVSNMAVEISAASDEQAQGVGEISKAMHQLDQVTQQNTQASQELASSAETLAHQSTSVRATVNSLTKTIYGHSQPKPQVKQTKTPPPSPTSKKSREKTPDNVVQLRPTEKKKSTEKASEPSVKAVSLTDVPSHEDPRFEAI